MLLTFVHADGHEERLEYLDGMTVLECALYYGMAGIRGRCGGVGSCATCHCSVLGGWLKRVAPATEDEIDLLADCDGFSEHSRLACQIRLTPALDGLRVSWLGQGPTEGSP